MGHRLTDLLAWRRRLSRLAAATALTAVALAGFALPATGAHAAVPMADTATADCGDWQSASLCEQLVPTFSCVFDNGDGSYTAALGYTNPTDTTLVAAPGSYVNSFYAYGGFKTDQGQIASFPPGTSETAFTITWSPGKRHVNSPVVWELGGFSKQVSFTSSSAACSSHPVPIMGSWVAAGIALVLTIPAFLFVNARRRRSLVIVRDAS